MHRFKLLILAMVVILAILPGVASADHVPWNPAWRNCDWAKAQPSAIFSSAHKVYGTARDDIIVLTGKNQHAWGLAGNDLICDGMPTTRSNSHLFGGPGNDTLWGNGGVDHIYGGPGYDICGLFWGRTDHSNPRHGGCEVKWGHPKGDG